MDPADFVGYIIMFLFGAGALGLYQYNKSKARTLPLSVQIYPRLILEVLILKEQDKTKNLVVRVTANKEIEVNQMFIELIDKNREITKVGFADNAGSEKTNAIPGKPVEIVIPLEEFKTYLNSKNIPFSTFRFVIDAMPNDRHKTHELAFNKNWNIYKPDSGRYN